MNFDLAIIAVALAFAAFLALALERVYEAAWASWFKPFVTWLVATYVKPYIPGANPDAVGSWATMAGSMIAGVLLAYAFGIDLLSPLAVAAGLTSNFYAGFILTGLAIGGGANLFHAIFGIYEQGKAARKADAAYLLNAVKEGEKA